MAEKIPLPKIYLKYDGLFDFNGLYAAITDWAKNYGYMWHEAEYKHKVPSSLGAEQEMKWNISKNVTDYIQYLINMHCHTWEMQEVEVEVNGQKRELVKAKISLTITGTVVYDWQSTFKKGKFAEKLGSIYGKLMMRDIEIKYVDPLYYRMWNLHAVIKKYFDMQSKIYAYKGYLKEN